jgi:hypothetical protein
VKQARQLSLEGRCHGIKAPTPASIVSLGRAPRNLQTLLCFLLHHSRVVPQHQPAFCLVISINNSTTDHGSLVWQLGRCYVQGMHHTRSHRIAWLSIDNCRNQSLLQLSPSLHQQRKQRRRSRKIHIQPQLHLMRLMTTLNVPSLSRTLSRPSAIAWSGRSIAPSLMAPLRS